VPRDASGYYLVSKFGDEPITTTSVVVRGHCFVEVVVPGAAPDADGRGNR
jgi:hypothetical protein